MLRLEGQYGHCFVDIEKIVAVEAWHNGLRTRIVFKGGGEVIVNGDIDEVSYTIELRRSEG